MTLLRRLVPIYASASSSGIAVAAAATIGAVAVRLVHFIEAAKRKELMIIYAESLAPTGLTAAQPE
jgi:hypothetical protein